MTPQEATKLIKELYYEEDYCLVPELAEALDLAIKALKRQIPQKPLTFDDYQYDYICPNCGLTVEMDFDCNECHQVIDWSMIHKGCNNCLHFIPETNGCYAWQDKVINCNESCKRWVNIKKQCSFCIYNGKTEWCNFYCDFNHSNWTNKKYKKLFDERCSAKNE